MKKHGLKENIQKAVQKMDLPVSAVLNLPRIEISGDMNVLIEHHKGIIDFDEDSIVIGAKNMNIKITGSDLELSSMNKNEIELKGKITGVELVKEDAK